MGKKWRFYPYWPGKVVRNEDEDKPNRVWVYFYGSEDYAWLPIKNVKAHTAGFLNTMSSNRHPGLQKAIVLHSRNSIRLS